MSSLREAAINALKKKNIEPTTDRVNAVVASLRIAKIDLDSPESVTASADFAVDSSMKFDGSNLLKNLQAQVSNKKPVVPNKNLNLCGQSCPRCGKPLVYATIAGPRQVAYCTNGCNIVVPFHSKG